MSGVETVKSACGNTDYGEWMIVEVNRPVENGGGGSEAALPETVTQYYERVGARSLVIGGREYEAPLSAVLLERALRENHP